MMMEVEEDKRHPSRLKDANDLPSFQPPIAESKKGHPAEVWWKTNVVYYEVHHTTSQGLAGELRSSSRFLPEEVS